MTVAKIKEYAHTIAEYIKNYREVCREEGGDEERIPTTPLQNDIEHLVSMLDELEPNENTSQWLQHLEICGYVCDNCGHISEIKDNVCSNCGARMNDELEENE